MFSKFVLAVALAAPVGAFALSGPAFAVTAWQPNGDYSPKYDIPLSRAPSTSVGAIAARPAMSCSAARRLVREDGFHQVRSESCYVFDATRDGRRMVLHVNPRNGHVS